ncbi:MAG: MoaD/ThiS family protein [Mycobacteriales bacterium]
MSTVRYFAAARAAAGVAEEAVDATTLAAALDEVRARHGERLTRVLSVCSFVVDEAPVGGRDHADVPLGPDAVVDCLPPFAGG